MCLPMEKVLAHIRERQGGYVEELAEFLAIPSVSTDPAHARDVHRCAEYCRDRLSELGFPVSELIETDGHPIVLAERLDAAIRAPNITRLALRVWENEIAWAAFSLDR